MGVEHVEIKSIDLLRWIHEKARTAPCVSELLVMIEGTVASQTQHNALRLGSRRITRLLHSLQLEISYGSHHDNYARMLLWLQVSHRTMSPLQLVSQHYLSSDNHGSCCRPADETEEFLHLWVKRMVGTAFNIWSYKARCARYSATAHLFEPSSSKGAVKPGQDQLPVGAFEVDRQLVAALLLQFQSLFPPELTGEGKFRTIHGDVAGLSSWVGLSGLGLTEPHLDRARLRLSTLL